MVTGSEYIFDNIDEALKYVLETEQRQLTQDAKRKTPPTVSRSMPNMFSQPYTDEMAKQALVPVDSQDYLLSAWFSLPDDSRYKWAFEKDNSHVIDYEKRYVMKVYKDCLR